MTELFGAPIYSYTRAQALADGVLVDVSSIIEPCPFKYPVALTRGVWMDCIEAGGVLDSGGGLMLPAGQDVKGRLWDVFHMLLLASRRLGSRTDRLHFQVSVFDGRQRKTVELWSLCGPGDNAEPVITIMLEGED